MKRKSQDVSPSLIYSWMHLKRNLMSVKKETANRLFKCTCTKAEKEKNIAFGDRFRSHWNCIRRVCSACNKLRLDLNVLHTHTYIFEILRKDFSFLFCAWCSLHVLNDGDFRLSVHLVVCMYVSFFLSSSFTELCVPLVAFDVYILSVGCIIVLGHFHFLCPLFSVSAQMLTSIYGSSSCTLPRNIENKKTLHLSTPKTTNGLSFFYVRSCVLRYRLFFHILLVVACH